MLTVKAENELSIAATARRFAIGKATIVRWMQRTEPNLRRQKGTLTVSIKALHQDIEQYPDAYQYKPRLGVSQVWIWYALKCFKVTYKKTFSIPKRIP